MGTRFCVVSEVDLGQTYQTYDYMPHLLAPPDGYHSVHGVKRSDKIQSDFSVRSQSLPLANQLPAFQPANQTEADLFCSVSVFAVNATT